MRVVGGATGHPWCRSGTNPGGRMLKSTFPFLWGTNGGPSSNVDVVDDEAMGQPPPPCSRSSYEGDVGAEEPLTEESERPPTTDGVKCTDFFDPSLLLVPAESGLILSCPCATGW